ncbi:winged helix-turn-helix transcriptional regulator, partial [Escherichia coli]|uniref:winged helix-turn-helix transcriptional regulator n=1 Tax=Escherichia coli TaxID=562 RepID=UPI001901614E
SKTGKGLLEVKNKSKSLSRDLFKLLNLVDGKSGFGEIQDKLGRISDKDLLLQLRQLSDLGFIKEVMTAQPQEPPLSASASYVDDLDFTSMLAPAKPGFYTSAQTEQKAREEAERKTAEAKSAKAREDVERQAREQAERVAREEAQK